MAVAYSREGVKMVEYGRDWMPGCLVHFATFDDALRASFGTYTCAVGS